MGNDLSGGKWERHGWLLSDEDVETLTGRKNRRLQCQALLAMKIPFAIDASGDPLVPRSAIDVSSAQARRDVKMVKQRIEYALSSSSERYLTDYRIRFARCTGGLP